LKEKREIQDILVWEGAYMQMIRDIVYHWNSNIELDNDNEGVVLSGKYIIKYIRKNNNLSIQYNDDYMEGFWEENKKIHDCFAIVGDNGAGKTMLVNRIMEDVQNIKSSNLPTDTFIIVAEGQQYGDLLVGYTEQLKGIKIVFDNGIKCKKVIIGKNSLPELDGFEIAYFHNSLSYKDYFCESRCNYDFSLGQMINRHRKTTYEMHYDDLNKDNIKNYYDNEAFRIISFLYNYALHNDLEIEFPVPKVILVGIADIHYNEDYILNKTKQIRVDPKKEEALSEASYNFAKAINKFVDTQRTWISCTIKNLIFNCFITLCIPSIIPNNISGEDKRFFEACAFLNNESEINGQNIYIHAIKVIENIKKSFEDARNKQFLKAIENFIEWLKRRDLEIKQFETIDSQLYIVPCKNTENFMRELLELYSEINFASPFFDFSFGVSTGEYYFLSVFSNLYSMVESNSAKYAYDYSKLNDKTSGILLIFDEADLSMHPRWQRMYMKWVIDFCKQVFRDIYVKIVITTHSPILLSDFPAHDVLYLQKDREGKIFAYTGKSNTFGSNIHTLFLNSFFLEDHGIMGAFAEEKINFIAKTIFEDKGELENLEENRKVINYIGEGIIREKLENAINKYEKNEFISIDLNGRKVIRETLLGLNDQKKYLDQLIKELEGKIQ